MELTWPSCCYKWPNGATTWQSRDNKYHLHSYSNLAKLGTNKLLCFRFVFTLQKAYSPSLCSILSYIMLIFEITLIIYYPPLHTQNLIMVQDLSQYFCMTCSHIYTYLYQIIMSNCPTIGILRFLHLDWLNKPTCISKTDHVCEALCGTVVLWRPIITDTCDVCAHRSHTVPQCPIHSITETTCALLHHCTGCLIYGTGWDSCIK